MGGTRTSLLSALHTLAVVGLVAAAHGCGSSEDGTGGGGGNPTGGAAGDSGSGGAGSGGWGASGGSGGAGGTAATGGSAGIGACGAAPVPPEVPAGWVRYAGYCDCPMYVPGPGVAMPDPIEWEPCPTPGPASTTCKRIKTPWTKTTNFSLGVGRTWFDPVQSRTFLQVALGNVNDDPDLAYFLIADVDGPVHNAFFQVAGACTLHEQSLHEGRYAYGVIPMAPPAPGQIEGILAGAIGAAPSIIDSAPVETSHAGWEVTSSWLIRIKQGKFWGRHWDDSPEVLIQSAAADPEGLGGILPRGVGGAVFWEVGGLKYRGVMAWTETGGLSSLIRYLGDFTQGAGNFATDGVDMVWTHAEGKAPSDSEYPKRTVMTAPFSTDPSAVAQTAKALTSDPSQLTPTPYAIGCGYAAHTMYQDIDAGTGSSEDLFVVRLSDGVSWIVDAPPVSQGFKFTKALGLTCDEVFAQAQFPDDVSTVVRIRLDSLGPGTPPS